MKRQRFVKENDDKGLNRKYKHERLNEVVDLLSDDDDDDGQSSCQVQQQKQQLVKSSTMMENCYGRRSNKLQASAVLSSTNQNKGCNKNDNVWSVDDDDDEDAVEVIQMKSKKTSSFMTTGHFLNRLGATSGSKSKASSDSSHSKTDNIPDVIVLLESDDEVIEEENTEKRPILITSDARLNSERREEEDKKKDSIHINSHANDFKSMTKSLAKEEVKEKETMVHNNSIINNVKAKQKSMGIDEEALENEKMNHSSASTNDLKLHHMGKEEDSQKKKTINHTNSSINDGKAKTVEIEEEGVKKATNESKPITDAKRRMASSVHSLLPLLPPSNDLFNSPASSPSKLSRKPLVEIIPLLESQRKLDDLNFEVDESGKALKKKTQKENSDTSNIVIGKYMPLSTSDLSPKEENINYLLSMSSSSFILGFHRLAWTTDKYCRVLAEVERFPPDQKKYPYLFDAFHEFGGVLNFDDIEKDRMVMKDNRQFQYGSLLPLGVEVLILFHTVYTFLIIYNLIVCIINC